MDKSNTNSVRTRMRSEPCSLFFIRPDGRSDAHASAERLMRLKGVAEVVVTSGPYAFMVKSMPGRHPDGLKQRLARRHGRPTVLECHYRYKR